MKNKLLLKNMSIRLSNETVNLLLNRNLKFKEERKSLTVYCIGAVIIEGKEKLLNNCDYFNEN